MAEPTANFYDRAFQRNLGLISLEEQARLRRTCVAVAGAGGVGGLHLLALARMGVGRFHLADFDTFEVSNINRQFGATADTIGRSKIDVMGAMARAINPEIDIVPFDAGVQLDNVDRFLTGVDLVVDGIDFFAFNHRRLLFNAARRHGLHVITSGPVGFGSTLQVFAPTGMSFDEYFGITDDMPDLEKFIAFATGLAPAVLHRKYMDLTKVKLGAARAPVVASSCMLSSGLVAFEAVNVVLGWRPVLSVPHYFQFDARLQTYRKGYLRLGAKNPMQYLKRWLLRRTMRRIASAEGDASSSGS